MSIRTEPLQIEGQLADCKKYTFQLARLLQTNEIRLGIGRIVFKTETPAIIFRNHSGRFVMRSSLSLFTFILVSVAWAEDPKPITPAEAAKHVSDEKVIVEFTVKKGKNKLEKRGVIYLDSEDDFKDKKNLGIAISAGAAAKFKAKGIEDPAEHFLGKTIRVSGNVMVFENNPYLPVLDPEQITIVPKK